MNATSLLKSLILLVFLGSVAACGRAGPLQPPAKSVSTPVEDDAVVEEPEDKPFVLDGLLN